MAEAVLVLSRKCVPSRSSRGVTPRRRLSPSTAPHPPARLAPAGGTPAGRALAIQAAVISESSPGLSFCFGFVF